ncbi:MAG TPA: GAF domain-containing protein, partial [bacterium]|nr:GAF domain-containing protein [bacterium]
MAGRPGFTNATISLRWLALASLIALEALLPTPAPRGALLGLYSAIFAYVLALTLYVWRYPDGAERAGRAGVALDTLAIAGGMLLTGHRAEYLFLAFPVAALAGFLLGVRAMVLVTAIVAVAQIPVAETSLFAPDRYLPWVFTVLTMLAAGAVASVPPELSAPQQFTRILADLRRVTVTAPHPAAAAEAALILIIAHFHARSGSVMLFDKPTQRLEILAARHLDEAYKDIRLRLGEGIAGWVAQEGHAVLLTPEAVVPFPLARGDIGSSICIPLMVSRAPLGVLNLNRSPSHERFVHEDLRVAELAAHQLTGVLLLAQSERTVAAALAEMAEGFGEVSRALSRDPAVLWPALLDMARSLTSAHFAVLALEREDTGNMDIVATRGIDGRIAHEFVPTLLAASTHGEIQMAEGGPNQSGVPTAMACVPLRTEAGTLGAIGLGLPDGRVSARLLNAVASHVAAAVHTARSAYRIADI